MRKPARIAAVEKASVKIGRANVSMDMKVFRVIANHARLVAKSMVLVRMEPAQVRVKGFTGDACQKLICKSDCNGRGLCTNTRACVAHSNNCTQEHTCKCEEGYGGETCEKKLCPGTCGSKHGGKSGVCNYKTGVCECGKKYYGMECEFLRCPSRGGPRSGCSGHGRCDGKGTCRCDNGWIPEFERTVTGKVASSHAAAMALVLMERAFALMGFEVVRDAILPSARVKRKNAMVEEHVILPMEYVLWARFYRSSVSIDSMPYEL